MDWSNTRGATAKLPEDLAQWAQGFPDLVAAWNACERPDWLVRLAAHVPLNNDEGRKVLLATEAIGPLAQTPLDSLARLLNPLPSRADVARRFAHAGAARLEVTDWLPTLELAFILSIGFVVAAKLAAVSWAQSTAIQLVMVIVGTIVATIVLGAIRSFGYASRLRRLTFADAFERLYDRAQAALRHSTPERIRNLTVITRQKLAFVPSKLDSRA